MNALYIEIAAGLIAIGVGTPIVAKYQSKNTSKMKTNPTISIKPSFDGDDLRLNKTITSKKQNVIIESQNTLLEENDNNLVDSIQKKKNWFEQKRVDIFNKKSNNQNKNNENVLPSQTIQTEKKNFLDIFKKKYSNVSSVNKQEDPDINHSDDLIPIEKTSFFNKLKKPITISKDTNENESDNNYSQLIQDDEDLSPIKKSRKSFSFPFGLRKKKKLLSVENESQDKPSNEDPDGILAKINADLGNSLQPRESKFSKDLSERPSFDVIPIVSEEIEDKFSKENFYEKKENLVNNDINNEKELEKTSLEHSLNEKETVHEDHDIYDNETNMYSISHDEINIKNEPIEIEEPIKIIEDNYDKKEKDHGFTMGSSIDESERQKWLNEILEMEITKPNETKNKETLENYKPIVVDDSFIDDHDISNIEPMDEDIIIVEPEVETKKNQEEINKPKEEIIQNKEPEKIQIEKSTTNLSTKIPNTEIIKTYEWTTFMGTDAQSLGESERSNLIKMLRDIRDPGHLDILIAALQEEEPDGLRPKVLEAIIYSYHDSSLAEIYDFCMEFGNSEEKEMATKAMKDIEES